MGWKLWKKHINHMVQCVNLRKMPFKWDKHPSCSSYKVKVQNVPYGLIKLYSTTMQLCTFPNNMSLPELLLVGNLSLTEQSMISILCGIKCKCHMVHSTGLMGKHETTYIHSSLCLCLTNTNINRHKSESSARKDLAHWSHYPKFIPFNCFFYLKISTKIW